MSTAVIDWPLEAKVRLLAKTNPVGLCRALGDDMWDTQADIMRSVWANRETYCASAHAIGKTYLEARVIAAWVAAYYPEVLVVVVASTEDQIVAGVWRELQHLWLRWGPLLPGDLGVKQWAMSGHGVIAMGRSPRPERPGSLQGMHSPNMLVVVDEAPEVAPELWGPIRSLLTGANTRLLAAGNPTRTDGDFYRSFLTPTPGVHTMHVSAFDTPNLRGIDPQDSQLRDTLVAKLADASSHPGLIDARYVLRVLDEGLPNEWAARILGQFPDSDDDTLIPRSLVEQARASVSTNESFPLELGLDVARSGPDRTVLFPRRGPVVYPPEVRHGLDTQGVVGFVAQWCRTHKPKALKVDEGYNPGVYDLLRERLSSIAVRPVISGGRAFDPEDYANRRGEMWFGLRDRLRSGDVDLSRLDEATYRMLLAELTAPKWKFNATGKRILEPKDETKKRLGRSPDLADALVYAFARVIEEAWAA